MLGLLMVSFFTINGEESHRSTHTHKNMKICAYIHINIQIIGKKIGEEEESECYCVPHHEVVIRQDQALRFLG